MRQRLVRILILALGAGCTAEFLLGDQWLGGGAVAKQVAEMVLFVVFYGSAAVLIREVARRTGRGWPTILLLALAFGLLEEGVVDQTLFNRHYFGLDLLAPGYVPLLGIGVPWTIYVLSLHVIWSIGAPIAVAEGLFPRPVAGLSPVVPQSQGPWLGRVGLVIVPLGYVLGALAVFTFTELSGHFMASLPQLATSLILAAVLVLVALRLPRVAPRRPGSLGRNLLVGVGATTAYQLLRDLPDVSAWLLSVLMLITLAVGVLLVTRVLRPDPLGLGAGAVLTYGWLGLVNVAPHGAPAVIEQSVLVALALGVLVLAWRRRREAVQAERVDQDPATPTLPTDVRVG